MNDTTFLLFLICHGRECCYQFPFIVDFQMTKLCHLWKLAWFSTESILLYPPVFMADKKEQPSHHLIFVSNLELEMVHWTTSIYNFILVWWGEKETNHFLKFYWLHCESNVCGSLLLILSIFKLALSLQATLSHKT